MQTTVLTVEGMSCEHCVKAVTGALKELPGVGEVQVDLGTKKVTVQHEAGATQAQMKTQIEDQGYDVVG